jgi:glycine cleavage system regulatory protein
MMQDFLLDNNGDLKIDNDDVVIGESTAQHQKLLLTIEKGGIKENPTATVGLISYLESENKAAMLQDIRRIFSADGMEVNSLQVVNGKLEIDAAYKS